MDIESPGPIKSPKTTATPSVDISLRIAVLGWGSLLWESHPEFDRHHGPWQLDGPELKLEFCRVSETRLRALTLVVDPDVGAMCRVAYTLSTRLEPSDAVCDLVNREGTSHKNVGFVVTKGTECLAHVPLMAKSLVAWAKPKGIGMVIWTDLRSNFAKECGVPFSVETALKHIQSLGAEAKVKAAEYIWRAPLFVDTPLRRALQKAPWF